MLTCGMRIENRLLHVLDLAQADALAVGHEATSEIMRIKRYLYVVEWMLRCLTEILRESRFPMNERMSAAPSNGIE